MKYKNNHNRRETKPLTRNLKKKPLVILIGVLLICNILWFIAWIIPNQSWKTGEEVASVDGETIERETWMAAMEEKIGRETLLDLVNDKVMEAAAKKYDIKVSDKEIDFELALIHAVDNRAYTGLDLEKERQKVRSEIILEEVLTKDVVISDEEIESYYDENASLYNIATAYRTAVIILPSESEADKTLSELLGGSDFNVLAKERSYDLASASLGGDIGYINDATENIDEAIVKAASSMKVGTISDVLPIDEGYYAIIQVVDVIEGQTFKLKDSSEHIKRELALEQLPESVSIETFWKEFDAKWFYGE